MEVSLIENVQRDDLNPLEEAGAYKRLVEEFGISQEELGTRLGKDRTTITNTLRLLKLPPEVKDQLLQNRISSGHARAILSLEMKEKQKELCNLIIQKGLSVREAEALAKQWAKPKKASSPEKRRRRPGKPVECPRRFPEAVPGNESQSHLQGKARKDRDRILFLRRSRKDRGNHRGKTQMKCHSASKHQFKQPDQGILDRVQNEAISVHLNLELGIYFGFEFGLH